MENFKENDGLHEKAKKALIKGTKPPDIVKNLFFKNFDSYEVANKKAHKGLDEGSVLDIPAVSGVQNKSIVKPARLNLDLYLDDKVTPQVLQGLVDWLCGRFDFVYIENMALYLYDDGYLHLFTYNFAMRYLMQVFRDHDINYALRSSDYKELVKLLQAQPQIMKKQDDCITNSDCILFSDGAFNVPCGEMCKPCMEDYQFSKIEFPLQWGRIFEASPEADSFIKRFCGYDEIMEDYLWELIGYMLSSYQKKILVVFIGPSNSGKSTLANMVRRICGSETCVAIGIKELAGSFSLAELQGKRLCIDSEMDSSELNARDISLLKKVVGNDLIQGNRKYEQPFYFQCQTKFLVCTNNKIKFNSNEDITALLNRIKIFKLKESIPLEEQYYEMDKILDKNRTYFLQKAMKGICRLVNNNFIFSYNELAGDFIENVSRHADLGTVKKFVQVCCGFGEGYKETVADLYNAYKQFVSDNEEEEVSIKKFSCFLIDNYEVKRGRNNKERFFTGIKLMTDDR